MIFGKVVADNNQNDPYKKAGKSLRVNLNRKKRVSLQDKSHDTCEGHTPFTDKHQFSCCILFHYADVVQRKVQCNVINRKDYALNNKGLVFIPMNSVDNRSGS